VRGRRPVDELGVPGRLLHDCRRTVCNIVNEAELHQAGAKLMAYLDGRVATGQTVAGVEARLGDTA
jgi:hypothetical protein